MTALRLAQVSVWRDQQAIVRDVSLNVEAGTVTAIIGPNGAGKSTLFQGLLGRCAVTGRMEYGGLDLATLAARERAQLIGYVPQRSQLRSPIPVRAVIAAGRYARISAWGSGSATDKQAIDQAMHDTDVSHLADRPFTQCSGGEQQRILIARALAGEAQLLCLDEPTAGLDPRHAVEIVALVRTLAAVGRSVVMILHRFDEVIAVADHVVLLHHGTVYAAGTPAEVLTAERIHTVYGVEPYVPTTDIPWLVRLPKGVDHA